MTPGSHDDRRAGRRSSAPGIFASRAATDPCRWRRRRDLHRADCGSAVRRRRVTVAGGCRPVAVAGGRPALGGGHDDRSLATVGTLDDGRAGTHHPDPHPTDARDHPDPALLGPSGRRARARARARAPERRRRGCAVPRTRAEPRRSSALTPPVRRLRSEPLIRGDASASGGSRTHTSEDTRS